MPQDGALMDWPVKCPICGDEFDSKDSYGDSRAMLRSHIENVHPEKQ